MTRINKPICYWYKPVTISSGENLKIKLGVTNNENLNQTVTSDTNNNYKNDQNVKASVPAYLIGFKNNGNTCYINASMQATIGLCYFVQRILSTFDGQLKFGKRIVHLSIKLKF